MKNVIFFDGHCNLCNGFVNFLIKIDHKKKLKYAPLQGHTAEKLGLVGSNTLLDSVVYYRSSVEILEKSGAVFAIINDIGFPWSIANVFSFLPKKLNDFLYDKVAKNRFKIFGKKSICRLPKPEEKERFLS